MPANADATVALVTGATSGLGLATATALAAAGAHVLVAGRRAETAQAAAEDIRRAVPGARVEGLAADLAVQRQVRSLAAAVRERTDRLDLLVNNAGAVFQRREQSADGIELTLAVNHLAPFLLTRELLEPLAAAPGARILTISSVAHRAARLDLDDLQLTRGYRPFKAYAQSKLANLLFTAELARRLPEGPSANALHPGLVHTRIGAKAGRVTGAVWWLVVQRHRRSAIDPQAAGTQVARLATGTELAGVTGAYFEEGRRTEPAAAARDADAAARLWTLSEQLTAVSGRAAAIG